MTTPENSISALEVAESPDVCVTDNASVKRAVKATMLGNAMEWFDFGVYAYLATTIGKVFFPDASGSAQLLSTFAIFAAAFIVRPLGGLFFGPLGDRIGRKKVLATTIILMAGSTFAIGLIPSYESIGIAAPILLVLLRLLQGFSTGGEYGGASTFVAEYAPDKRRGFFASFLEFGTLAGYVAAAGIVTIIQTVVSAEDLLQWGWRIPFLIAGPLGLIGLYLRLRLEETPAFQMMEQAEERSLADESTGKKLRETLVDNWRPLVLCIVLVATYNIAHYGLLSYMPTYLTNTLGYDESHGLVLMIIVMIVMMMGISYVGKFSDRVGRKPLLLSGFIGFFVLSLPAYLLIGIGNYVTVFLGLAILGGLLLLFVGVFPSVLPALFPTGIRYGGLAIGYNLAVSIFGGTTPLVLTALESATGSNLVAPMYMMIAAVIGGIAVLMIPETARKPLDGSPPAVATDEEARRIIRKVRRKRMKADNLEV
ncbi:MFS transporter [Rhodococcus sp. WS1]|jgi:MHS family proline/betaine transporter-like MFS transporter|uniref:Putative proline/betaine transporter n=3 Tax=Rhodococcus erythropolis TaxID=1833 RepID=C1A1K4_RHOE4|nr:MULTISPECIES: MFS transporter [Rhodococcus]AGT93333.1 proline/betaine transporter [Rhodococcus erythropolis CCM2595]EQM32065.1 MFS transporter [Rhodococcus erythropolis DN1]MBF7734480.1 MFS transporter [Rhodococcus erythropolis]MBH5141245.1 MFS transporter [Rhodococcus erythropolis]MBS2990020.1 MFS transporter [Rhodococcus erythropolis]